LQELQDLRTRPEEEDADTWSKRTGFRQEGQLLFTSVEARESEEITGSGLNFMIDAARVFRQSVRRRERYERYHSRTRRMESFLTTPFRPHIPEGQRRQRGVSGAINGGAMHG
jgi:hypothetical protein